MDIRSDFNNSFFYSKLNTSGGIYEKINEEESDNGFPLSLYLHNFEQPATYGAKDLDRGLSGD